MRLLAALVLVAVAPGDRVVRTVNLAAPFATRTPWRLTIIQAPDMPDPIMGDGQVPGAITACLSPDGRRCVPALRDALRLPSSDSPFQEAHELLRVAIVRPRPGQPLLLVQLASLRSGNGNQRVVTQLFGYDRANDRFRLAFQRAVGRNNNEEVRYIDNGPLAGAVIVAEPTEDGPFGFWIGVHRLDHGGSLYRQVLRYRSVTRYGDGDPLAVIDSDMPETQRRLGLWRARQSLPVPANCPAPRVIRGELWCSAPPAHR